MPTLEEEKSVAFYQAVVQAWVATRMELDRTLVTLAAAGVGLLVTLVTNLQSISPLEFVLYLLANLSFILVIVTGTIVFRRNSQYLEEASQNRNASDPVLKALDRVALGAFYVGVALTFAIGLVASAKRIESVPCADSQKRSSEVQTVVPLPTASSAVPNGTTTVPELRAAPHASSEERKIEVQPK